MEASMSALRKPEERQRRPQNLRRAAVRDGRIVMIKSCANCGEDKIASTGPESEFPLNGWKDTKAHGPQRRWKSLCKICSAQYERDYRLANTEHLREGARRSYHERMQDPAYAKLLRDKAREQKRREARDPVKLARRREREREWKRRQRKLHREKVNAEQRHQYAVRMERKGRVVRPAKSAIDGTQPRLPAEVFRRWLVAYDEFFRSESVASLADELGLDPRRINCVLGREYERVAYDVVSRALTNARETVYLDGRMIVTIDDLYDEEELMRVA